MSTSYATGSFNPPIPEGTIGEWFDRTADRFGDRDALIIPFQTIRWTWRQLREQVDSLANGFARLNLQTGDRIGICAPNCVEWVLTQLASAKLGLVLVSINPACRTHELGHVLRLTGVRALVTASRFKSSDYIGMLSELMPTTDTDRSGPLADPSLPDLRFVIEIEGATAPTRIEFASLLLNDDTHTHRRLDALQPINIQFTSGTTGLPKGATLSHRNLLHDAVTTAAGMRLGAEDRLCIPVPLYHCFGMVLGVLVCVVSGAAMIFPATSFEPGAVLRTIGDERCTALHGVPTMFLRLLDHPDLAASNLATLRTGIVAGAPCPPSMMRRMIEEMNLVDITIGYGMTETSPLSTQTAHNADLETRTETVGTMLPHFEGRVIDETGAIVPLGTAGEYCARGPGVMLGYWGQPDATAAAIRDGWMHSGDLATMDDAGRIRIVGRIKDMIIRGGENIYPAEIEAMLTAHPLVAEAAVFGIADDNLGETVAAWVRVHEPVDGSAIVAWCGDRLAHHKVPSIVRVVDGFPMTVTGKIQKFAMRDAERSGSAQR